MSKKRRYWKTDTEAGGGRDDEPGWAFLGGDDDDLRDVTQPVAYDEQGRPLYAPRGIVIRPGAERFHGT